MKIKREEVLELLTGVEACTDLKGVKVAYAIAKNSFILEQEKKAIQAAIRPKQEYVEYDEKRIALCKEYAELDENNKPVIENNTFKLDKTKIEEFNFKLNELKEENKSVLEDRNKQVSDFNDFLQDEIELNLYLLKRDDLPDDIVAKQLMKIIKLIED